jgi:hypothetical protein
VTDYPVYKGTRSAGPVLLARGTGFITALVILPVFLIGGFTLGGWLLGVGLFTLNWLAAIGIDRLARGKMQVTAVGLTGIGLISRAWLTFGGLFIFARTVDEHVGVVGAIVFLIIFTTDFVARAISHAVAQAEARTEPEDTA